MFNGQTSGFVRLSDVQPVNRTINGSAAMKSGLRVFMEKTSLFPGGAEERSAVRSTAFRRNLPNMAG
jgi:hypothetical protein